MAIQLNSVKKCSSVLNYDFACRSNVMLHVFDRNSKFACSVVVPGRAFLRRLIDLTVGVVQPHRCIRLTRQAKLDIAMWLPFFQSFNGRSFFLNTNFITGDYLQLYTDASGSVGYGAVYGSQ